MIQIKFIRQGSNSMLGGFSSGDTARVSEALAAHLVNEAKVAEYVQAKPAAPAAEEQPAPAAEDKPSRSRKKAAA